MSFNILQDNNLDIEITLAKRVRKNIGGEIKTELETVTPIDMSAILELSIKDSLLCHGIQGSIKLNNKFGILDKLKLTADNGDDLYISIQITDSELLEAGLNEPYTRISVLCYIQNAIAASANIQDNLAVLRFEEAFIAEMKQTSWEAFYVSNVKEFGARFTVADVVKVFNEKASELYSSQQSTAIVANIEDEFALDAGPKDAFEYKDGQTVYDVFKMLLKKTTTRKSDEAGKVHHLPLFRFVNVGSDEPASKRQMKFTTCFTDRHREFISEAAVEGVQNTSSSSQFSLDLPSNYYGDVYTEKFTVGPIAQFKGFVDPNTNWHNSIENFNVIRPDIDSLKKEDWVNYKYYNVARRNVAYTKPIHELYPHLVSNFMVNELGLDTVADAGVNLPLLDPKTMQKKTVFRNADFAGSNDIVRNNIFFDITQSFITVNEQVDFESKGRIFRQPGKFIWIETGDENTLLEKLWFVNSVTHKFIDGQYTTQIQANRFFGSNTVQDFDVLFEEAKTYLKSQWANLIAERKKSKQAEMDATQEVIQRAQNNDVYGTDTPKGFSESNAFGNNN